MPPGAPLVADTPTARRTTASPRGAKTAQSKARYRLLAEDSDVIILLDEHGRRSYVSPACETGWAMQPDASRRRRREDSYPRKRAQR
jgi:hypothetical protein